ncbi:Mu transposase C-terminal domain-containing protein [Clostridium kluyveri]|uniref:Mu transposase C-terminal domain-containing protein n=1 Tax=Clostridium kluyveri TaxID=1534 RepID=UPI0022471F68|nr:Mu transposase C-terminal domain-containing protein [Clostridium kluyveri]UZQ52430.1 Mu transposase C-terminal domain-containing protein [Clostridium kluyveri]
MIVLNNLINFHLDNNKNTLERVLWLDKGNDTAYLIDIYSNYLPYSREISGIEESLNNGTASVETLDPFLRVINEMNVSEKHLSIREKAWESIKDIVVLEPFIFNPTERRKIINEICKSQEVHESTILRYLKRYWQRGKTKNALLPDYYHCGGLGKEKEVGQVKRGRPRKNEVLFGTGINIDEEIKKVFKTAINKYYYTTSQKTLTLTYELMLKEFFSKETKIKDNKEIPIINSISDIPTFAQFKYWFQKERNYKKEITMRKGEKKYEQKHRAILGNSTTEALGPGAIYQIDATIGDIYLVSRFNREWIIGRPVVYSVIDTFSRMIVGIYIGLEGPSWNGAMMALANAAANKAEFCKEYGIEISQEEWPVNYLPETILADRGELEGSNIETLVNTFHIRVQNTAPYRPEMKGIVESQFRVINTKTKPLLPGVVNIGTRERGDKDYRLDAKLDIYQFTQIIIKCILHHNNHNFLKNYSREEMMIQDDIEPILPVKLWNWGIANRSGKLKYVPEDIVKLNLMPTGIAIVTAHGIKFKGLLYGSKESLKERWFEKARNSGSWKIDICYDERIMSYIYIKNSNGIDYEKCFLLEHQQKYKDKTLDEINYLLNYEKLQEKKYLEQKIQTKVDLISEIEHIVKEAQQQSVEKNHIDSNKKRLKNIRENRRHEKALLREKEAFELDKSEIQEDSKVVSINRTIEEENNDGLTLLLKKQKEALKKIYE